MNIDWFRWGIDPWIIEHPIFGGCLIIATIIYLIVCLTIFLNKKSKNEEGGE